MEKLRIDWASRAAAEYACQNWHCSGLAPVGKLAKVGAWEDDEFIGVMLFDVAADDNPATPELVSMAFTDHTIPVSLITSIATDFLIDSSLRAPI